MTQALLTAMRRRLTVATSDADVDPDGPAVHLESRLEAAIEHLQDRADRHPTWQPDLGEAPDGIERTQTPGDGVRATPDERDDGREPFGRPPLTH